MGGQIAKYAFYPPDPAAAERVLRNNPHHTIIFNSKRNPVSLVHIPTSRPLDASRRYTLIFSHGNAEDLANYQFYAELARCVGVDVVAYDYSGYGLSTSRVEFLRRRGEVEPEPANKSWSCTIRSRNAADSTKEKFRPSEAATFACADAVFDHITTKHNVRVEDIVIIGRSLGSGPASYLAAKHPNIRALVLLSPLKSCAHVAGPAAGVALYPFDIMTNLRRMAHVKAPTLLVHGTADSVIAFAHSQEIAAELRKAAKNAHVRLLAVDGAGHNDVEEHLGWIEFYALLRRFVSDPHTAALEEPQWKG